MIVRQPIMIFSKLRIIIKSTEYLKQRVITNKTILKRLYLNTKLGKNNTICGTYVTKKRVSNKGIRKGMVVFTTLAKGTPVISLTMYRHIPKGGVTAPIKRLMITINPK